MDWLQGQLIHTSAVQVHPVTAIRWSPSGAACAFATFSTVGVSTALGVSRFSLVISLDIVRLTAIGRQRIRGSDRNIKRKTKEIVPDRGTREKNSLRYRRGYQGTISFNWIITEWKLVKKVIFLNFFQLWAFLHDERVLAHVPLTICHQTVAVVRALTASFLNRFTSNEFHDSFLDAARVEAFILLLFFLSQMRNSLHFHVSDGRAIHFVILSNDVSLLDSSST